MRGSDEIDSVQSRPKTRPGRCLFALCLLPFLAPFLFIPVSLSPLLSSSPSQQIRFEDVVRNLRNPDPKVRMSALRLLRDAQYVEAITPVAALINDPLDDIQLEAIATELSFFLVADVPSRRRVGFVVEVRTKGQAPQAFEMGPLAVWPRPVPPELIDALLKAIDDEHQRVRVEAIYTLGTVARPPLANEPAARLVKALDHYDPIIRAAAARVIGRLEVKIAGDALVNAMNDSNPQVRYAAMRALGDIREIRAVTALTEQYKYYSKGEGAWAALDALARLGHASSVPLFRSRLGDRDENLRRAAAEGLGRLADASAMAALQAAASTDSSESVRAAASFAMQQHGHNYLTRLVDFMTSDRITPQIQGYLFELGAAIVPELLPRLQEPEPRVRAHVAEVLGVLGTDAAIPALEALLKDSDRAVVTAATNAITRIKFAQQQPARGA
jgi:HEAT repeat protein